MMTKILLFGSEISTHNNSKSVEFGISIVEHDKFLRTAHNTPPPTGASISAR